MTKELYLALAYVILINLTTFVMFYIDKQEHRRHRHPHGISTHIFMTLAVLGGSLGELLGMWAFHHKRHHKEYLVLLPIFLLAQIIVAAVVLNMYFSTDVDVHDLVPA
jgi:uncharacterized membrane protein YsdA (DUF1294 family)